MQMHFDGIKAVKNIVKDQPMAFLTVINAHAGKRGKIFFITFFKHSFSGKISCYMNMMKSFPRSSENISFAITSDVTTKEVM